MTFTFTRCSVVHFLESSSYDKLNVFFETFPNKIQHFPTEPCQQLNTHFNVENVVEKSFFLLPTIICPECRLLVVCYRQDETSQGEGLTQ